MTKMRWKKPTVAVAVGTLLAAGACGGDGDDTSEEEFRETGTTGQAQDPTRQPPAPPIEGATQGGVVKVLSENGLNTMMPTEAYYTNTHSILENMIVRTLTQFVYDPEQKDMVLVPDMATDLGTANEDNTEWTFTLRDGLKYENGDPVEPEDFITATKLSMDRETFPDGATYSNDFFLHGGCDPADKNVYEGYYTDPDGPEYDGVEVNGNEITFKMACPFPDMPYWASFAAMSPIPEELVSDKQKLADYTRHPLATGPYMMEEYTPEKSLTLVRNPHWDPNTDPGRHAYPDKYVMDFDTDGSKINEIIIQDSEPEQATLTYDELKSSTYLRMKQDAPERLVVGGVPCTWYLAPDYRKITELEVRQALMWGFPYDSYLDALGLTVGVNAQPGASNIAPPGIPGREEYNVGGHQPGQTDPAKAKQLLAEAGYEPGEYEVTWLYARDDDDAVAGKDQVVKGLEEAGFKVTPVATTDELFSTDRSDPNSNLNLRNYGWCSDWPSFGSWTPVLFGSTDIENVGFEHNYSAFNEPEIDKQLSEIALIGDPAERAKAYNALEQEMQEKYLPGIPIYYTGTVMGHGSAIQNFNIDSTVGMPTWKDMWVKQ